MEALRSLTDDVVEQQLSRGVQLSEADKAFLRKVLGHYQTFAALRGDGPESRVIRGEGFHRVGYLRHRLGELHDAEAAYDEAIALRKPLVAEFPDVPQYRRDLALSYTQLANLLSDTGRPGKAEAAYRETLALRKQLVKDYPGVPGYVSSLADIHMNLGILLKNTGRPRGAEEALRECLSLRKQLAADSPKVPDYRQGQAKALGALGLLLGFTGRPKEAERPSARRSRSIGSWLPNSAACRITGMTWAETS
jgi:tetratricopeptide (TPR) repeat protein